MPLGLRQVYLFRLEEEACPFSKMIEIVLQEALDSRVGEDILVINLRLKDVLQAKLQLLRKREMIDVVVFENGYTEDPLTILRNTIVLRIHDLPIVGVSVTFKLRQPLVEIRDEFLADESFDILKQEVFRLLLKDGFTAFPQKG